VCSSDLIAVASLNGMILILDGSDHVVSAVGGEPPVYLDGKLQPLQVFNYTFNHPHDVYVDSSGALYVPQWWSNQTYPIKLELVGKG
jgi:peptidylamidoglycolate lyase